MDPTAPHLPPGWQVDSGLARLLPSYVDWREYCRLPENPDRYLASICGNGIWDIYGNRFLTPRVSKGRRRYRLNLGPNAKPVVVSYSRVVASLVFGPPPRPDSEAHHERGVEAGDGWTNLKWQSPKQNRAVEAERQQAKRRLGTANGNATLTARDLEWFVRSHDKYRRKHRLLPQDWQDYAHACGVSERQLRRIAGGQSRRQEVAAIRKRIAEENPK